jgi:K+-sensing histidine kinase KdpD
MRSEESNVREVARCPNTRRGPHPAFLGYPVCLGKTCAMLLDAPRRARLDEADEIVLADLPPDELVARLRSGSVCDRDEVGLAVTHLFRGSSLTELRSQALAIARRHAELHQAAVPARQEAGLPEP